VDATHHLFNKETFDKMKNTAYLINTSRGPIVDSKALAVALQSGNIAGAGVDVLEQEPPDPNDALMKLDNFIVTPHTGFYSDQSSDDLRKMSFEEVVRVLQGGMPKNLFNKELAG
jgi:D-3-phosphoglycerate dehydrogenase